MKYRVEAERTLRLTVVLDDDEIEAGDTPEDAADELLPDLNAIEWELVDWNTTVKKISE